MNPRHLIRLMVPVLPAVIAIACGGANDNLPPPPPPPPPPPVETTPAPVMDAGSAAPAPTAEAPPAPPAPPPTLTEGTASPDPDKPTPTVSFVAPAKEQVIPAAKVADFEVKLDVKNWKTAPGDAHVHLILDNKPYKPIFDPKAKVTLGDLFGSDTPGVGQHVLVAFPSRANHESVKTKGALSIIEFWIDAKGKKDSDKLQDITKPTLIYSRPKGEYKGDMANHLLVDFQLANVTLAPDKNHVHIAITGPGIDGEKTADVTKFGAPYYLDNPAAGSYDVKVDLLGADGKVLPGNWNSTARTITVTK